MITDSNTANTYAHHGTRYWTSYTQLFISLRSIKVLPSLVTMLSFSLEFCKQSLPLQCYPYSYLAAVRYTNSTRQPVLVFSPSIFNILNSSFRSMTPFLSPICPFITLDTSQHINIAEQYNKRIEAHSKSLHHYGPPHSWVRGKHILPIYTTNSRSPHILMCCNKDFN